MSDKNLSYIIMSSKAQKVNQLRKDLVKQSNSLKKKGNEKWKELLRLRKSLRDNMSSDVLNDIVKKVNLILESKKVVYSITVSYKTEIRYMDRKGKWGKWLIENSRETFKKQSGKKMTVREAKDKVRELELERQQGASKTDHKYTYKKVSNVKMDGENNLGKTRMFKMDYKISGKMISDFIDNGEDECVYDFLLHRYNGVNNLQLTKNRIYGLMFDDKEYDFKKGVSTDEVKKFCQYFKIPMYALDATERIFDKHIPEKKSKAYKSLSFIVSNNHMYPIEDTKHILSISMKTVENKLSTKCKKVGEIKEKELIILPVENLDDMLDELIEVEKQLPTIGRYNDSIKTLTYDGVTYVACRNKDNIEEYCKLFEIKFEGQDITLLSKHLFTRLYPNHKESYMNQAIMKAFQENNKSAFNYTFKFPDNFDDLTRYDINKCYTHILETNEYEYCVFHVTDEIKKYDGKGYDRPGAYWVETDNFFPLKRNGLYMYSTLMECAKRGIDFKVKYQILCSETLPHDYFKKYVDEALRVNVYKLLCNTMIGYLNKINTQFFKSRFTTDYNEACYFFFNRFKDNNKGFTERLNFCDNTCYEGIYEIETMDIKMKYENSKPVYNQIIEAGWIKVYDLYKKMGGELIAVKTDSVTVKDVNFKIEESFERGQFSQEEVSNDFKNWKIRKNVLPYNKLEWDTVDEQEYVEDFDGDEFGWVDEIVNDIIESKEGYYVDGRAGTGKSVLCKKLAQKCKDENLKYIILAPTNKAALNVGGCTLHKFFGMSRDDSVMNKTSLLKIYKLDYLFIDEISMVSKDMLKFLSFAKQKKPSLKFILIGDGRQLPPVGEQKHLETDCVKMLSDCNKIELTVNKRFDEKLRDISDRWYSKGKINLGTFRKKDINEVTIKRFLCYTNVTRKRLNAEMMNKYADRENMIEYEVDEDDSEKQQDLMIYEGLPIIAICSCRKNDIYNNEEYTVTGVDGDTITISTGQKFELNVFVKMFTVGYAITIHKSQGQTYTEPYMIEDIRKIMWSPEKKALLYVALTRAKDLNLVHIR